MVWQIHKDAFPSRSRKAEKNRGTLSANHGSFSNITEEGSKKTKQEQKRKRVRNAHLRNPTAASTREDHTGSRAIEWLTEIDRRAHTCLMDTSIHMNPVRAMFSRAALVNANSKAMGRKQVLFQKDLRT